MKTLHGLHVLVLGLGASGLAMARWCTRHGAHVTVWDSREQPPQAEALRAGCPEATLSGGALDVAALNGVQWVLKSPGLAPADERIEPLLQAARATGVRMGGELDLFALALADLKADTGYAPQLLAITGTNGKTTTTALTALLVERAGRTVAAAGNIGPTLLDTLAPNASMPAPLPQVWVLELSSFQLDGVQRLRARRRHGAQRHAGPPRLARHMAAYAAAKARIFGGRARW
jgi:UDP-N-acetylmuramoylalanine--D-glutamate ligase